MSHECAGMSSGIRSSRGIVKSWSKGNRSKCSGPGRSIQFWQYGLVSRHNDLCRVEFERAFELLCSSTALYVMVITKLAQSLVKESKIAE